VVLLDALPAEDSEVVGAVEMLDSLLMVLTQFLSQSLFIIITLFKIKVSLLQDRIFLHNFIEDINIKWQSLSTF
jgi:hypothetical protein